MLRPVVLVLTLAAACANGDRARVEVDTRLAPSSGIASFVVTIAGPHGDPVATLGPISESRRDAVELSGDDAYVLHGAAYDAQGRMIASIDTLPAELSDGAIVAFRPAIAAAATRNRAPVIDALVASATSVEPHATITLSVTAHDPDGDPLAFAWSGPGTFASPTSATTTWTAPTATGTDALTITVTDSHGASDTMRVSIQVKTSAGDAKIVTSFESAPQISTMTLDTGRLLLGVTTKARAVATDPDGDALTYSWRNSCAATFTGSGKAISIRVPTGSVATTCTLHVDVDDGRGLATSGDLVVGVGPSATPDVAPVIDQTFQSVSRTGAGGTVVLRAVAHDAGGGPVSFAWTATRGTLTDQTDASGTTEVTWHAPGGCFAGEADIDVTASDASGASITTTFAVIGTDVTCPSAS